MPNSLTTTNFDDLLKGLDQSHNSRVRVDLSEISLITPGAIIFLAVLLEARASSSNLRPVLVVPNLKVRSYLLGAGFFKHMGDLIEVEPPISELHMLRDDSSRRPDQLHHELTSLVGESEIPELLLVLQNALRKRLGYQKHEAYDFGIVACEISQNIFHHNTDGIRGWVAMQVYRGAQTNFVELAIGDSGVGINGSLANNPKFDTYETDVEAISQAIQVGVSQFPDQTRGNGFDVLMEKVFKHGGTVTIRSGCGKVHIRMDKRRMSTLIVPRLHGTQVVVSLPQKEVRNGDRT